MITTALTTVVFLKHNSTPVVKSTTRELSYIILSGQLRSTSELQASFSAKLMHGLSGIMTCYAVTFSILAKPSSVSCFLTRYLSQGRSIIDQYQSVIDPHFRIIPPIAFSIVYSALLTKTNRIARILAGSKKRILTKKPRFLSTFSQARAARN